MQYVTLSNYLYDIIWLLTINYIVSFLDVSLYFLAPRVNVPCGAVSWGPWKQNWNSTILSLGPYRSLQPKSAIPNPLLSRIWDLPKNNFLWRIPLSLSSRFFQYESSKHLRWFAKNKVILETFEMVWDGLPIKVIQVSNKVLMIRQQVVEA